MNRQKKRDKDRQMDRYENRHIYERPDGYADR